MLIDTHCHMRHIHYDNIDEVINRMDGMMITSGYDDESNLEVLELINKHDNLYGTLGFHPSEVNNINDLSLSIIESNLNNKKIVGIGETGLDYHWHDDNKEFQREIFNKQIELARKYNKPVVVHSREAIEDTYEIISANKDVKFIMHCFSGSLEMAKKFTEAGVMLGIGGVSTFKNAKKLAEVIEEIDLDFLLLETDSPYLAPVPHRGQKNEPAYTELVADKIATIKGISREKVIEKTYENAVRQFDLPVSL